MDNRKNDNNIEEFSFKNNEKLYDHLKNLSTKKITELHNTIFNDKKDNPENKLYNDYHNVNNQIVKETIINKENNHNNQSDNINPYHHNDSFANNNSISSQVRIVNLEKRLEKSERMLKYFEEILKNRDNDKNCDVKIDRTKISDLNKRILTLEESIKIFHKKISSVNEVFNEKFDMIEKKYNSLLHSKDNISDFYSNKIVEIENLLKKNDVLIDNVVEFKLSNLKANLDNK